VSINKRSQGGPGPNDEPNGKFAWCSLLDLRQKIDDLVEVMDDDFTFASNENANAMICFADHIVIVSPSVRAMCEPVMSCVGIDVPDHRAPRDPLSQDNSPTESLTPLWLDATRTIDDFFNSLDQGSKDTCEWRCVDVLDDKHDGTV
jgi:hypothetical protein